jgi:hypothetical protein
VLALLGWAWAPVVSLGLTGEDYAIFSRFLAGESAYPHVFRPWSDGVLRVVYGLFGAESAAPYHVLTLVLHVLNTGLVFLIARRLFGSAAVGCGVAALFALGAGCADSLSWVAAVNRPLSSLGALLAMWGLVGFAERPGRGVALCLVGLGVQYGANEEVYGTALLVIGCLLLFALRWRELWRPALVVAAIAFAGLLLHAFVIGKVPGGKERVLELGLAQARYSITTRAAGMAAGWGLPEWTGLALPFVCAALIAWRRRGAAAFALAAWAASFVPYALSDAVGYRFYPTQAPTALLLAGGVFVALKGVVPSSFSCAAERAIAAGLCVAALVGSQGPREERLERWHEALGEIELCKEDARALATAGLERPPVLVNLESTTAALFLYHFEVAPGDLVRIGFLDAATGHVEPGTRPEGPWYGRRREGSYGSIDAALYLAESPRVEALRLYGRAVPVGSLAEARARLADGSVDVTSELLVEAEAERLASLDGGARDARAPGAVQVLEPFVFGPETRTASMRVRVSCARAAVLAYQENTLYQDWLRVSPDQTIFSGVRRQRVVELRAHSVTTGQELDTFYVNAFGLGALVPPGEHEVQLDFSVATPAQLR